MFTSFTLSQLGMVRYQLRQKAGGWRLGVTVSAAGATATFLVLIVVATTKFTSGAWLPAVVIPFIVLIFKSVRRHYSKVADGLRITPGFRTRRMNHTVVVLVGGVHKGVLEALAYARSLAPNHLFAVTVVTDEEEQERIERQWEDHGIQVPLEIVYSPYRELTRPVLAYIDEVDARFPNEMVTVVIPEFVVKRWWEHALHNQSALFLKGRLLFRKETAVLSLPYHLE
ncbi:MAG: hypothetical protein M5U14_18485 [Acidimicrobiia bacterium]|nr:hypothetical protein [Acidimicrobiia bacterium]